MTRYLRADGRVSISWDDESEPVDWTTPNVGDGIDDEYCGNCAWDPPGCGCPRDPDYAAITGSDPRALPVQRREDPPLPVKPASALCRAHRDDCPNGPRPHTYHPPELDGLPCCRQPGEEVPPR